MNKSEFRDRVESAINITCMENGSNTPDFILATYLTECLEAFDRAVSARETWYGREPRFAHAPIGATTSATAKSPKGGSGDR